MRVLRRSRFLRKRVKETEDLWKTGHESLGFCMAKPALSLRPAPNVEKDIEGLQTMRNLARNAAFLIRAIDAEKQLRGLPAVEHDCFTSFPDGK